MRRTRRCEQAQYVEQRLRIRANVAKEITMIVKPNIVLVHGAWADGSSWSAIIEILQAAGYHVTAPQFRSRPSRAT